jgi:predicted transposase YbfD/YdcC
MNITEILPKIKDNRSARGKRYSALSVVKLLCFGLLCGKNNIAAIHRWAKKLPRSSLEMLGFEGKKLICYSNLTVIIRSIEIIGFNESLDTSSNRSKNNHNHREILHIDGKCLKGSNSFGQGKQTQILTAFCERLKATLGYQEIINKNEQDAMLKLLDRCNIENKIITADAAFCHEEIIEKIASKSSMFAIALKGNEPNLLHHTKQAFAIAEQENKLRSYSEETDLVHGRIEQRRIDVIDMPFEYLNGHRHIKQLARITRIRELKNKASSQTVETAYMITNLAPDVTPKELLELNRRHWSCENNLNWVKDNIFMEDKSTISLGNAPIIMSLLRSFALQIIATISDKITETREYFESIKNTLVKKFAF